MKKLTKKSLEELALVMPVISELHQRGYVGGTVYFDQNGNRVGEFGSGSEIKVLDDTQASNFENAKNAFNAGSTSFTGSVSGDESGSESGSFTSYNLTNFGSSLKNEDANTKLKVFQYYGCIYCPDAEVSLNISGNKAAGVWSQPSTGQQHLEVNPDCDFNFNEKDIKSVMKHESLHLQNPNNSESQNIVNEGKSTEFKNASENYKANEAKYLFDEWKTEDPGTNKSLSDACSLLGASYALARQLQ